MTTQTLSPTQEPTMSLIVNTVRWGLKTHMTVGGVKTLCGRRIPKREQLFEPNPNDYCSHCERAKKKWEGKL